MFFNFGQNIGVDLGTATVLVYIEDKGIVLQEPSVVALDKRTNEIVAIGKEARRMLGRTPENIVTIRPLREGVIADFDTTERMLRHFVQKACGKRRFFKPRIMVCIPSGVTSVEERAVREAALQAGAREAYLIEEPLAAAIGAGIDITKPEGNMVVDIGGGTTDIAVLSMGGTVYSTSLRIGGDRFDEAVVRYMRREHNLLIGESTAEALKIAVGAAYMPSDEELTVAEVRGRDLVTGLPKIIEVDSQMIYSALQDSVQSIIAAVKEVFEKTPPELVADILDKSIIMTGGGSLLRGLDVRLTQEMNVPFFVAEDTISCVAIGTGKALSMVDTFGADSKARRVF
jgi:rod shape-determining protein MreB